MILRDTFTRQDSATLGVAEQGGTWTTEASAGIVDGSIGVVSGHAEVVVATTSAAVSTLDAGATNQVVQVEVTFPVPDGTGRIAGLAMGYGAGFSSAVFVGILRDGAGVETAGIIETRVTAGVLAVVIRAQAPLAIAVPPVVLHAELIDGVLTTTFDGTDLFGPLDIAADLLGSTLVGIGLGDGPLFSAAGVEFDNFEASGATAPSLPGPCELFTTLEQVQELCPEATQEQFDLFARAVTRAMFTRTGRQFGLCRVRNLRPCAKRLACGPADSWGPWVGLWRQWWIPGWGECPCACSTECSCTPLASLDLGVTVYEVHRVLVDGVELPATSWHVDQRRWLVRTDGEGWPACQDLAALSGDGVFLVDLTYGVPAPENVQLGAAAWICELIKAKLGQACTLPENIRSTLRQGVATEYVVISEVLSGGLVGVYLADLAIQGENPAGIVRSGYGVTPGRRSHGRQVGP